jgi:hypothetical protein
VPKKLTHLSILNLWDELSELYLKLGDPQFTENDEATLEARVKEIGAQLFPDGLQDPMERDFWALFRRQNNSSEDYADFWRLQHGRFAQTAAEAARKHIEGLTKLNNQRWNNDSRDMQMAREFRQLKKTSKRRDSKLKEDIGKKRGLKRSASIEAVNRGEQLLARPPERGDN